MPSEKRQRQKAARAARQAAEQAAARRRQTRRRGILTVVLVVGGALLLFFLTGDGGDDTETVTADEAVEQGDTADGAGDGDGDDTAEDPADAEPAGFQYGTGPCAPADGAEEQRREFDDAPQQCIDPAKDYRAILETSMGTVEIDLHTDRAPGTVNNFVNLARWNFYDGVIFHRVIPDFVVQGGDPTGTGTGGPGYQIADELPDSVDAYEVGSVAMANSGPDTNGSQFFIYFGPNPLPGPDFSLFGQVTPETLDTARQILEVETGPDDRPVTDVVINDVTIVEEG